MRREVEVAALELPLDKIEVTAVRSASDSVLGGAIAGGREGSGE